MRTSTSWACAAILSAAVGGTFTRASGGGAPDTAPPPRAKPTATDWLPKPGSDPHPGEKMTWVWPSGTQTKVLKIKNLALDPPTAFPDLILPNIPRRTEEDRQKHLAAFEKKCPRLYGTAALKIEPTDDALRTLLKARLHQGVLEHQAILHRDGGEIAGSVHDPVQYLNCLLSIRSTATELWAGEPKELAPWLEEVLIAFKLLERDTRVRVQNGSVHLCDLHTASRLRLQIEADLWKLKNPK